jgi:hypothetical protein
MNITVKELRALIREEFRGVPLFAFREATRKYVDDIRQIMRTNILVDHSPSAVVQKEAFDAMDEVLDELEKQVNELLEDKLYNFMQRV